MITFISEYPDAANEKDGMMQRVLHVDRLCADAERQYLTVSFSGNFSLNINSVGLGVRVVRLNFFIHFFYLALLVMRSRVVYCHSIYNALRVLPFFLIRNIVVDMHGSVPEELAMMNKPWRSLLYRVVECIVLWRGMVLVCVTRSMVQHFVGKYSKALGKCLVLPILSESAIAAMSAQDKSLKKEGVVVYSGGAQAWQNVELMLQCAASNSEFCYCFLTPDVAHFNQRIAAFERFPSHSVQGVRPEEVSKYYANATYGFLLRDDIVVNRVACPTKCVEYISNGMLPVLKTKNIGDFQEFGLASIDWQDFAAGRLPTADAQSRMIDQNYSVLAKMHAEVEAGSVALGKLFAGEIR